MLVRRRIWDSLIAETDATLQDLAMRGEIKRLGLLDQFLDESQSRLRRLRKSGGGQSSGPAGLGVLSSLRAAMQSPPPDEESDKKKKKRRGKLQEDYEEPEPGRAHQV